jgi:HSP20 family molecular chaperone IbpA
MATVDRRKTMSERKMTPATTGQSQVRRWDPFSRLSQLESEFERLFDVRWPRMRPFQQLWSGSGEFMPRVDVYEQDGNLVTKAELPGVKKEDIDISIEGGDLIIRGERKQESEVKEENYYRMERSSGRSTGGCRCRKASSLTRSRRTFRMACWRFGFPNPKLPKRRRPRSRSSNNPNKRSDDRSVVAPASKCRSSNLG